MSRFGIWLMVLMERWMAWLERPLLPWLERRIHEHEREADGQPAGDDA